MVDGVCWSHETDEMDERKEKIYTIELRGRTQKLHEEMQHV